MSGLSNLALILFFFGCGYFAKRAVAAPATVSLRLNRYVINIAFPAVILQVVPDLQLQSETLFMVLAPWLVIGVNATLVVMLSRFWHWDPKILCGALLLSALGNTGFLGFPIIQVFFTPEQLGAAIIYDQFGSFIGLCTYATILVAVYSGGKRVTAGQILGRIALFPPFATLVIAFFIPDDFLGPAFDLPLSLLSWSIIPCTMLSIGLQFSFRTDAALIQPIVTALSLKMLMAPVVVMAMGYLLGIPDWLLDIAIFEAATPPMVTGAVILIASGIAPKYAAATLGFGTLIALIYLPALAILLNAT